MDILKSGDLAPDFELVDQTGKVHKLSNYKGKRAVIYFYPRDMTPGCTVEAHSFCDLISDFKKADIMVFGISADSVEKHKKFADKENIEITLLSDPEKKAIKAYGAWGEKKFLGRTYEGIKRMTFLIGKDQKIKKVYETVKPKDHAEKVLVDFNNLIGV